MCTYIQPGPDYYTTEKIAISISDETLAKEIQKESIGEVRGTKSFL